MENPVRTFREALETALRSVNIKKLSSESDIPERHIQALLDGNFHKLPSLPYVRGYLITLSRALHLPEDELWLIYRKEIGGKTSGADDHLPKNRFALRAPKGKFILVFFIILIAAFAGYRLIDSNRAPQLTITNPAIATSVSATSTIILEGTTEPGNKLMIDNKEVVVEIDGSFTTTYELDEGMNTIDFVSKRIPGKSTTLSRSILFQKPEISAEIVEP